MKIHDIFVVPVKKYASPKYPTQTETTFKPELLRKLPSRWQKNAAVVAAAGFFSAMSLVSCGKSGSPLQEPTENIQETAMGTTSQNTIEATTEYIELQEEIPTSFYSDSLNFLNVAPVFIHGDGTGSVGCVMITPPVFLSEQEALAIIKSIAENEGLNFNTEPLEYIAVQNKGSDPYGWINEDYVLGEGKVDLDLYDNENQVAVTYISMREAVLEYTDPNIPRISFSSYFPRELAELTVEDFARQNGDINIGVFYEPGGNGEKYELIFNEYEEKINEIWKKYFDEEKQKIPEEKYGEYNKKFNEINAEYEASVKVIIEEDLRAQVRDFIEWLQGQGII